MKSRWLCIILKETKQSTDVKVLGNHTPEDILLRAAPVCIISTAQQASSKVMGQIDPRRDRQPLRSQTPLPSTALPAKTPTSTATARRRASEATVEPAMGGSCKLSPPSVTRLEPFKREETWRRERQTDTERLIFERERVGVRDGERWSEMAGMERLLCSDDGAERDVKSEHPNDPISLEPEISGVMSRVYIDLDRTSHLSRAVCERWDVFSKHVFSKS